MKWLPFILCLGLNSWLFAQDPFEEEATVRALIEQLGDDDFKVRQKASDGLMQRVEQFPEFAKYLRRFANHEDPEVRFRIAELTKELPVVLQWKDPAGEKNVKSRPRSPESLKLTIKNRSTDKIAIHWVDWNGRRVSRGELKPGQQRTIAKTFIGHYWLITDEKGRGLGLYVPKRGRDAQIIFTGEERAKK